jgi:hypothetical protein
MTSLRQHVSDLMVCRHLISPELADYHVRQMDDAEVKRRYLALYLEMVAEFDERSTEERLAWAKELIRKAREVPSGEQAPLPLTGPENSQGERQ